MDNRHLLRSSRSESDFSANSRVTEKKYAPPPQSTALSAKAKISSISGGESYPSVTAAADSMYAANAAAAEIFGETFFPKIF